MKHQTSLRSLTPTGVLAIAFLAIGALCPIECKAARLDVGPAMEEYQRATPCCVSMSDIKFEPLSVEGEAWTLQTSDPAYEFGADGMSYFKAFELPALGERNVLTIRSTAFNAPNPIREFPNVRLFAFLPVVTLLDQDKKVLASTQETDMKFVQGAWSFFWKVIVDVRNYPSSKYLIIRTTHNLIMNGKDMDVDQLGNPVVGIRDQNTKAHTYGSPVTIPKGLEIKFSPD